MFDHRWIVSVDKTRSLSQLPDKSDENYIHKWLDSLEEEK